MYLLLKMVVFHCYVSLPEGNILESSYHTLGKILNLLVPKWTPRPMEKKWERFEDFSQVILEVPNGSDGSTLRTSTNWWIFHYYKIFSQGYKYTLGTCKNLYLYVQHLCETISIRGTWKPPLLFLAVFQTKVRVEALCWRWQMEITPWKSFYLPGFGWRGFSK